MARRNNRRRAGVQGQRWVATSLSESVHSLTATVTTLELDATSLLAPTEDFHVTNDDDSSGPENVADTVTNDNDSSGPENVADTATPNPNSATSDLSVLSEDDSESEESSVNDLATVVEQVELHLGNNNPEVMDHNNNPSTTVEPEIALTAVDCATLDVLKLCHDAGTSLEFYDILFALLRKHSSKNKVDVTKLPKRDTFLKRLRARISSPTPIISQVENLQVPHFDMLSQIRDLLGSFIFNDLNNLCVNMDPDQRYKVFVATDDDKFVEMCAQEWYQQTYREFITDPEKQFLLPLIFYIDETGTDVFQRYPLEPLMFTLGILRNFIRERSSF